VRALEVVVLDEQHASPLAVVEVGEHRARQELFPHRLPEALDLAARLRMVRAAFHVCDAVTAQLLLEGGRASPGGVLTPLVGENLTRGAIVRDAALERLHHQRALLVVRHDQTHEIARVVVHEGRDVHALVLAQQEREQIRLPQLIGLGALEALHLGLRLRLGRLALLREPLVLQHAAHRRLGGAQPEEPFHDIADSPRARMRLGMFHIDHRLPARIDLGHQRASPHRRAATRARFERSILAISPRPVADRRVGDLQLSCDLQRRQVLFDHHCGGRLHHIGRPLGARLAVVSPGLQSLFRACTHFVHSSRATLWSPIEGRVLGY